MKNRKRNALIRATAWMAAAMVVGGAYCLTSEYWKMAAFFFTFGLLWLFAFGTANYDRIVRWTQKKSPSLARHWALSIKRIIAYGRSAAQWKTQGCH